MIRYDKHKTVKSGIKTQVRVVEGYRDSEGKSKQRTIKTFGYLEDQPDKEAFIKEVKDFDEAYKKDKRVVLNEKKQKEFFDDNSSKVSNFGYRFLETIYDSLKLDTVFNSIEYKGQHSLSEMFKFLVIQRILNPDSKRATYQFLESMYDKSYKFNLYDLYRALDKFSDSSCDIQQKINSYVKETIGRNNSEAFYDTTNFYFEKDYEDDDTYEEIIPIITDKKIIKKEKLINVFDEDGIEHQYRMISGLCKRGVSKEHRVDPIVQLGLFMDSNGIPINMQLYPGNTSDSLTLIPGMNEIKEKYNLPRIVVVADKGMNCSENINTIINNGDGYMFSQILKGKKGKRYQEKLFDDSLYTVVNDDYKYQIFVEDYTIKNKDGKDETIKRKVLLYWNGAAARREKKKRAEKLEKAKRALKNNAYSLSHGYDKYIKTEHSVESTGEIASQESSSINYEKAEFEEKFDGYFAIITSELSFDEKKIRETYHGLWRIEESFRVAKSDLIARPIFVRTEKHIQGHFLICYVALCILRILQYKMGYSLSVERIVKALNMCSCSEISNGVIHVIKTNDYKDFIVKRDKNGAEYKTLVLSEADTETVSDFKKIINFYNLKSCGSLMNKKEFDGYIRSIKLK